MEQLNKATSDLHKDLSNPNLQQAHGVARTHMQKLDARLLQRKCLRSRIRWRNKGDMVLKEFFNAVKEKSASSMITSLRNSARNLVKD
jgi:hypothetical protein